VNRELAGKLLESMKKWAASPGRKKDDVEDLEDFIKERTQIAAQTVALTRESTAQGWQ
jgi:phage I-like protein